MPVAKDRTESTASVENASTGPRLLLDWDAAGERPRWHRAAIASVIVHAALVSVVIFFPWGPSESAEQIEPPHIITRLVAPRNLTQKALNHGKITKDITADMILPRPRIENPAPGVAPPAKAAAQRPPAPALPKPSVPEPPKLEARAPNLPQGPQIAQIAPPRAPADEQPKLALQNPGSESPASRRGMARLALPGNSVNEAIRSLANGTAQPGMTIEEPPNLSGSGPGLNLPPSAARPRIEPPQLLSDPKGVDFRPYILQVLATVRRNWFAVYPESAKLGQRGRVVVQFAITKNGSISKIVYSASSNVRALDQAAVASLSASNPLPSLPNEFQGDRIVLQFTFLYNIAN